MHDLLINLKHTGVLSSVKLPNRLSILADTSGTGRQPSGRKTINFPSTRSLSFISYNHRYFLVNLDTLKYTVI